MNKLRFGNFVSYDTTNQSDSYYVRSEPADFATFPLLKKGVEKFLTCQTQNTDRFNIRYKAHRKLMDPPYLLLNAGLFGLILTIKAFNAKNDFSTFFIFVRYADKKFVSIKVK